eukprot:02044_6
MNGHVEVRTLYIQAASPVARPTACEDPRRSFDVPLPRGCTGRVRYAACPCPGEYELVIEKLLSSRGVLIRPNSSALEQILNRKIDVLRVDKLRRRRFRRKGQTLFELHLDSVLDVTNHFLGGKVERLFPPGQRGLHLGAVKQAGHLRCHIPGSLSGEPEASTFRARVRQRVFE